MTVDAGELERNLGFLEAMTLGGGTMIGAGIFILPALAAEGAGPASAISFAIAGFVALLAALSLSELATGMPIAGGSYHYVNRALGGLFGSIVGWGMWTGLMFASAFYMIGFGQYIVVPVPFLDGRALIVLLGLFGLGLITGINYYGTDESSGAQNIMIGAEFLVVVAYVALGVFFVDPGNLEEFAPKGVSGIVATTGTVFVTYLGFEIIATVAGEIKKPGKLIPLTMVLSVVSVTLLYVVIMIVSTGVVPFDELGGSLVPVSDVAEITMFGTVGVVAVTVAAAIAAISSSNSSVLAASRVIFAMGRDGLMSDLLNATHSRFNTPHRAILVTGGVTGLLVLAGLRVQEIVVLLAQVASFSFLVTYGLVHAAVVVFRRADPDGYDPTFRMPAVLYPAVPVLGVLMTVLVISQMKGRVILVGTGVVLLGVVWYFVYARSRGVESGLFDEAFGGLASGVWQTLPGTTAPAVAEPYRVVVGVANPETQRGLLRLAAATARAHAEDGPPELVAVNVIEAESTAERNVASERLSTQRALLANTQDIAAEMAVDLRTVAVVAEDAGDALVDVVLEEDADQLLVGWQGTLVGGEGAVFGPTLDTVVRRAPCDLSLVKMRDDDVGTVASLAGSGPHAPVAARQAADFAAITDDIPVLLNAQRSGSDEARNHVKRGRETIQSVADRGGLSQGTYEDAVVVGTDVEAAILEAVQGYETVCVGLSERSDASQAILGSLAERVSQETTGNVCIVRSAGTAEDPAGEQLAEN
jgi:amino acid transporter/nucleotide-binding universal stress UspA family protein